MSDLLTAFMDTFLPREVSRPLVNDMMAIGVRVSDRMGPVHALAPALMEKLDTFLGKDELTILPPSVADKRNRLVSRDDSDYGNDTSAGDFALASMLLGSEFTPDEADQIMRFTRYRDKFDRSAGDHHYLQGTIRKAAAGTGFNLAPNATGPNHLAELTLADGLIRFTSELPPKRDHVALGMVMGKTYVGAGFGGTGKSQLLGIQTSFDVALGGLLSKEKCTPGSVLGIFAEEDSQELHRRANGTAVAFDLRSHSALLSRRIRFLGMVGEDIRLTTPIAGRPEITGFADRIIRAASTLAEESGDPVRLIVLDHISLLHGGDFNERNAASSTMREVNRIAKETGAAVLTLAHSPKNASGNEQSDAQAIAGSTAFVDQARGGFVLAGMREGEAKQYGISNDARGDYCSLTIVKNNYGPTGEVRWYQRRTVLDYGIGVMTPVQLVAPIKVPKGQAVYTRVLDYVAAHRGEFSKTKLRDTHSGLDGPLKASKREVEAALDAMLSDGRLIEREPKAEERGRFRHGKQVKLVLDLPRA